LGGGFFIPNAVSYTSPSIGGFTFTGLTNAKTGSSNVHSALSVNANKYSAYSVTGAIGDVNVSAAYHKRTDNYTGYNVSANLPVGDFTLAANYMMSDYDANGSAAAAMLGVKVSSFGFGAAYKLSDAFSSTVFSVSAAAQRAILQTAARLAQALPPAGFLSRTQSAIHPRALLASLFLV